MTFDDDFIRIPISVLDRNINVTLKTLGLEWPPPEEFIWLGLVYKRERYSEITDEQRAGMTHVVRGAEYSYVGLDPNYEKGQE
jgi:hypothetical protein